MEKEEDVVDAMVDESTKDAASSCTKRARLHRSFLHLSKALKKLDPRRGGHHDNASGGEPPPTPSSSAAASFLSGCMHPRTQSFASGRHHRHDDALAVDFRSLRINPAGAAAVSHDGGSSSPQDFCISDGSGGEEREGVAPPRDAVVDNKAVVAGGVAAVTFSAAPYEDFRRSMREMVDDAAGGAGAGAAAVDWEFMEELLFCYLRLNDRAVHTDILRAFTDTVAALRRRRRRHRAAAAATAKSVRRTRRRGGGADDSGDDGDEDAVA